jgi:hypothetical protein
MREHGDGLKDILHEVLGDGAEGESARGLLTQRLQGQVSALVGQLQRLGRLLPGATAGARTALAVELGLLRERLGGLADHVEVFGLEQPASQAEAAAGSGSSLQPFTARG